MESTRRKGTKDLVSFFVAFLATRTFREFFYIWGGGVGEKGDESTYRLSFARKFYVQKERADDEDSSQSHTKKPRKRKI